MVPRGEVGIIVGMIGLSLHTITKDMYWEKFLLNFMAFGVSLKM